MANMRDATVRDVLRAAAVVTVEDGCVALPAQVLGYLESSPDRLFLKVQKEILLTPVSSQRAVRAEITRGALALPERVIASLGVADGDSIGMGTSEERRGAETGRGGDGRSCPAKA